MLAKFADKILGKIFQLDEFSPNLPKLLRENPFYSQQSRGFVFSITTRCNFHCPHCLRSEIDKNKALVKDLPISVLETVLEKGKKLGFLFVSFTGGEPILHPHFGELVSLVNKYGYRFNFASNGWLQKEYWDAIRGNHQNLESIFLSLDGVTPEVHDSVRNKPGSFEKIMETIKFYKSHNLSIIITFCVTKNNLHQIELLPDFCLKLGIKTIKWATVIPVHDEFGNSIEKNVLTDEERTDAFWKIAGLREKFKLRCGFLITRSFYPLANSSRKIFLWCPILDCGTLTVDHDGAMFFCCDINRECENKPLIQELGFEKSLDITLNLANEMKKKMINASLGGQDIRRFCDFCNKNIESLMGQADSKNL